MLIEQKILPRRISKFKAAGNPDERPLNLISFATKSLIIINFQALPKRDRQDDNEDGKEIKEEVMKKLYYVYMMSNVSKMIYTGVTNNLELRVYQHKNKLIDGFTKKYNLYKLVYYDETDDIGYAIKKEKEIKGWRREKKIALIESMNPNWEDLAQDWSS